MKTTMNQMLLKICSWSTLGRCVTLFAFMLIAAAILPQRASADLTIPNALDITIEDGRVTNLEMGNGTTIVFCADRPTGGFYIRKNTIPEGSQIPVGCTNILEDSTLNSDTIGIPDGAENWIKFPYPLSDPTVVTNADIPGSDPANSAAMIKLQQTIVPEGGRYAGFYQALNLGDTEENKLYYLTFEVKTECGWRALGLTHGQLASDHDLYGPHRVAAYVEWFETMPTEPPSRNPAAGTFANKFYADGTSQEMAGDNLTRFCGRTYRPEGRNYARIVLLAEGFMPDDGQDDPIINEVYIDNVYFFEAPPLVQVEGTDLLETSDSVSLVEYGTETSLNLNMDIESPVVHDDYIRIAGRLTNTSSDARAIDLGFAFPIKDVSLTQNLEWHYDVHNRILLSAADPLDRSQPFTFSGPVDSRPDTTCNRNIPTSRIPHNSNHQISAYPISSLGIDIDGTNYGLAFGDDLTNVPSSPDFTPSISHFGYRIVNPAPGDDFDGYYFVEFNIGLLGSANPNGYSDFDFIIFRSDDPEFDETSSFREGLQKYQREIFPQSFTRPSSPEHRDWQFGGGLFFPEADEQNPSGWDENGFTVDPNDFGYRYTQPNVFPLETLLPYCADENVGCQLYNLPWDGDFPPESGDDKNTHEKLRDARDAQGGFVYLAKRARILHIPPNDQELFSSGPYRFPINLAASPDPNGNHGPLVSREIAVIRDSYGDNADYGECFSGIQLDTTFDFNNSSNHLDMTTTRMNSFVSNGGRLTYSFNTFTPAIPMLATNVWFFPHLESVLGEIDGGAPYGDNDDTENQENELISVNAHESDFGGSKYGIICADLIAFETRANRNFNNSSHSFNFRRSLARDKSVARKFMTMDCTSEIRSMFEPDGEGPASQFWGSSTDLARQLFDEVSWVSLAWGFHPSIQSLFPVDYFGGDEDFDLFVEEYLRPRFLPDPDSPAKGYTEVFRQLHFAGWQPVTNVVNHVDLADRTVGGEPSKVYIERFGPYEGIGTENRPILLTLLNNEDFKVSCTDVVEYGSSGVSISELETDLDVALSNICEEKYGDPASYDSGKKDRVITASIEKDKNFYLIISNVEELNLEEGNIGGIQMIQSIPTDDPEDLFDAVNYPTIIAERFTEYGDHYSIVRINDRTQLRLGGPRYILGGQNPGVIEDKALMVFLIDVKRVVDNGEGGGGGERGASENPYYQRVGRWSTMSDETAREGSVDVISSEELGAYALFSIDIAGNARYDVQVAYPEMADGTSGAKYEVYLQEERCDPDTLEIITSTMRGPLLTTIIDQSISHTETMDEDRFMSIGTIEPSRGSGVDNLRVVVKVSSARAERRSGRSTMLLADAVRVENLDR